MRNKNLILIGLFIFFISFNVNAHTIDLPNDYILTYEKISNTDNCLIDCSLKFKIKLNKDYFITDNSFITKKFKNYLGNLDLIDSGFKIQSIEEYQYKDYNKPIYGEVEKQKFCNGIQGINFGIIDINTGWCNDSLCLMNSSTCYYEHEYNTYELSGNGVIFFYTTNEIINYDYSIGNKEVWNKFNPIGKTIQKDQWYYLELWGKKNPSINKKSTFINISLMGKFLGGLSWWNSSWTKKRAIEIDSNNNINNYQLLLNITYDSDMNNSFNDLRFTNEEENTELDYWIEYKNNGNFADIWIEIDSIDTNNGTQAYMYYGNSNVISKSNGSNTWQQFEDFEYSDSPTNHGWDSNTGLITSTNWKKHGLRSMYVYDGGVVVRRIYDISPDGAHRLLIWWLSNQSSLSSDCSFFSSREVDDTSDYSWMGCDSDNSGTNFVYRNMDAHDWSALSAIWNKDVWFRFEYKILTTTADIYINNVFQKTDSNFDGLYSIGTYNIPKMYLDTMCIGKYVYPEPSYSIGSELEDNYFPEIILNYPLDNSTNISLYPILNITIIDNDLELINVSFFNASNNNVICVNNSISNGTMVYCKWNNVSEYNTTYNWYVNATDNYTTTKSSIYNFTTQEIITTTIISDEGLINIRVIDLTDSQYEEILIYQNDNTSTKYIMTKNLSKPFKVCQNVSYSFIILPKTVSIIRNMDQYFLDYLFGNIYLLVFILSLISIGGYLIFRQK